MKLRFTILLSAIIVINYAQQKSSSITKKYFNGTITVQQYATNIYKLTFHSSSYLKNENITDAVILKPFINLNTSNIHFNKNKISFNKNEKAQLINIF